MMMKVCGVQVGASGGSSDGGKEGNAESAAHQKPLGPAPQVFVIQEACICSSYARISASSQSDQDLTEQLPDGDSSKLPARAAAVQESLQES